VGCSQSEQSTYGFHYGSVGVRRAWLAEAESKTGGQTRQPGREKQYKPPIFTTRHEHNWRKNRASGLLAVKAMIQFTDLFHPIFSW